jgi:hypothetical protein
MDKKRDTASFRIRAKIQVLAAYPSPLSPLVYFKKP